MMRLRMVQRVRLLTDKQRASPATGRLKPQMQKPESAAWTGGGSKDGKR